MKRQRIHHPLIVVLVLVAISIAFTVLTGASHNDISAQIGRYRLTIINRNNFPDLFVIDTATGVVKWVGQDEGKPFGEIKGR